MLNVVAEISETARIVKKRDLPKLTEDLIKSLEPRRHRYYVWHSTGRRKVGRLGVLVYINGVKEFFYRSYEEGNKSLISLGLYPKTSLKLAFERAEALLVSRQMPTAAAGDSVDALFTDYINYSISKGRRSMSTTRARLNQVLKSRYIIPNMPANKVTSEMIARCLAEFIERGAVVGSNKVRACMHAAFNFGIHFDNDPANINKEKRYEIQFNPVTVIPKQRDVEKALDRFLSWEELKEFIRHLSSDRENCHINHGYANLALLCIYSGGQRPYELSTIKNSNIDIVAKTMTITPEYSKTKNFHVVPLSDMAMGIINKQREEYPKSIYLFPANTKQGHLLTCEFSKQLRKYCARYQMEPFTPRDIRRTFKTLAGALGVSIELRDILQNHSRQGTSARHYDRYQYLKEKQEIIELWNKTLEEL
jgi:integrase